MRNRSLILIIALIFLLTPSAQAVGPSIGFFPAVIGSSTPAAPTTNVALAANGGVASASGTYDASYLPSTAINGDRKGLNWGSGGGWNDDTGGVYPDWLEIDFNNTYSIVEIDVFTLQDSYSSPSTPTLAMTFTNYGITDFQVQYWNGSAWVDVSGGNVTGNDKVWRQFTFSAISTNKIRVLVNASASANVYSRITEVEAWIP